MSRFKKTALSCVLILLLLIAPSVTALADTLSFYMPFSVPQLTDNSGYIELLYNKTDGTQDVQVIGWSIYSTEPNYSSYVDINITSNSVSFQPIAIGNGVGVFVSYRLIQDGNQNQYAEIMTENFTSNYSMSNLVAYKVYGNYRQIHSSVGYSDFVVSYGGNVAINLQLDKIIELLTGASSGTQDIIDNQNQNTQDIIDNQNQLQENEKTEAGSTGNSTSDELASVIPNDSEGFINSLGSFVGAMSTTATDCNIKIPQLKLPSVAGITPETVLIEEQYFNLGSMFNIVPVQIMTLLRALLDIALVVFCFKELYGVIEYVLTLRKGGG